MEKNLRAHLDELFVPPHRKELTLENLRWLQSNLAVYNWEHPSFAPAMHCINHLLYLSNPPKLAKQEYINDSKAES